MKTQQHFGIYFILLVTAQMLITNFFHFTPYVMLTMLPAMVLCIPLSKSTIQAMFIAFAAGLAVDMFAEGVYGINTVALVPVAALRKPIVRFVFGKDYIVREEDFSIRKNGIGKVSMAIFLVLLVYLPIYFLVDGAGQRPLWFFFARLGASLLACLVVSLIVSRVMGPDDRR